MGVRMLCHRYHQNPKLASFHLGQDNWCELTLTLADNNCDIFYLNGMIFMVNECGSTKVMDIAADTLAYVIPPSEEYLPHGRTFIVDACGDILRVVHHNFGDLHHYWFDFHRMDISESSSPHWVKVNNIGDQILFVDKFDCFVLCASDFAGIRANCIYALMKINQRMQEKEYLYRVERIYIETGAREHVPCPLKEPESWFVPNLQRL
ncbi:F-box SKIP23-like protein [Rhynchospora pubera]|uniref:F-box SKIP23-like protein n=1 Tax=Rhynchospora pubera TaxID=906938 RepID=A0AAV8CCH5_9POAL|nr:F-box SKIP23-like protein [Rhynchospora pubera]